MLSRRSFLLGAAGATGAVVLGACSGDEPAALPTTTTGGGGEEPPLVLGQAFDRNSMLVAGIPQRAPFLLFEQTGGLVPFADAPDELRLVLATEDGSAALDPIVVAKAGADVERAYYPLLATFPTTGVWNVTTEADGIELTSSMAVNESSTVPGVGDPLPAPPTPTRAAPVDVTVLCTREPACPFHEVSLADVRADGRPAVVMLSTPAYCQTAICGPVLDTLIAAAPAVDTIHIEVYPNEAPPDGLPSVLVAAAFGLAWEPSLFVAAADGRVTTRLDNIWDGLELQAALATVA